ncbi:MAG TPA: glycosyltransferase family 9 protein [Bacteroidales bacterium]|nr:glycosyltransferase family 9 protein [Bacteroidales bacterium]
MLKILIIRFSSIGDIVLTTPVLRILKNTPGVQVEVHYATKKAFESFLSNNPYIDLVHTYDGSLTDLIKKLRAENFDYIIDLHNNLRSTLVKLALRKPSKAFHKLNIEKWLLTKLKINRLPKVHIVDRYLVAAKKFNLQNDNAGLDFFLPPGDMEWPGIIPDDFRNSFIGFVIGGMHATKRMPHSKIIEVCRLLNKPVVLLGGPDDAKTGQIIADSVGSKVINACGRLSLNQSAFLVKMANVIITHDTGLMHIAAAFNKPIISIWGNTIPEFGMFPYMPQKPELSQIVEVKGLPCRPCHKIGYKKCPLGHFDCMEKINPAEVAGAALKYF